MASIPLTATEGGGRKDAMPGVEEERALDTGVLFVLAMPASEPSLADATDYLDGT